MQLKHNLANTFTTSEFDGRGNTVQKSTTRSKVCAGMIPIETQERCCSACVDLESHLEEKLAAIRDNPVNLKTPISILHKEQLVKEVKQNRTNLAKLQVKIKQMEKEVSKGIQVSQSISEGLATVLDASDLPSKSNDLLTLFWQEQRKALSRSSNGMRWHPMMIRLAIYLHYQSPRAYKALRDVGVLQLPNESTLRDYSNYFQCKSGFQPHVFQNLRTSAAQLEHHQRFVCLLHDEMMIKADLVYDKRSGDLIGFTDIQNWTFSEETAVANIATHVLVFMVLGINNHVKMSIGYFPSRTMMAGQMFSLMWKAISYLEITCNLKVISSTSDKAAPNQKLYRMHVKADGDVVTYRALNPYAKESRHVYFFSDMPHLMKTLRNNLEKSKSGGTRCLWNNGHHIWWSHVFRLYKDDLNRELYRTKLSRDHVCLTPSSRMRVRLAVQVLSNSVGKVMETYYDPEMSGTAKFCLIFDRFFDCLNVRSHKEGFTKRKPDLLPYSDSEDTRFKFLTEDVLGYLDSWEKSVINRPKFDKAEKSKMLLSAQTLEGIRMTVYSFVGATMYLLAQGVPYILSQNFCQDVLEEHFGRHRGLAGRATNPTLQQFGYQENKLRLQRSLAFAFQPRGNTAGNRKEPVSVTVTSSPLKKLKRH